MAGRAAKFNIRGQAKLFEKTKFKKAQAPLRESEKKYFRDLKRRYNRQIEREVAAWKKVDERATYESLVRQGLVQPKFTKGIGDYKTRKDFFRAAKALETSVSPEFIAGQADKMRERMKQVIEKAYQPEQEVQDLINAIIDRMSVQDMVKHGLDNPQIVSDFYDKYKENVTQGVVDAEMYDQNLLELLQSLEPYADSEQYDELEAQEYLLSIRIAQKRS